MAAVAASFTIWSNRHAQKGGQGLYANYATPGNQNDAHNRHSNADARFPKLYLDFEPGYRHTRIWTNQLGPYLDWLTAPAASAEITGTITASATEVGVVAGGLTLIITLTNDTWVAAGGASFDLQRQNIINGVTSAQGEALGWNLVPKVLQGVAGVIRTSDTVVTITWDAFPTYDITAQEVITVTVPGTAVVGTLAIVAVPNFTIDVASGLPGSLMLLGCGT